MKSFCAIDMGLSVALEIIWHGYSVKRSGTVFYICGEGKSGIGRRIKAFLQHHGIDPVVNVPFFVSERPARFLDDPREVTKAISELIKDHGTPVLVIVDTLNRNFGAGDENQTPDMTKFVNAMDDIRIEFGCTVLIVHHSGLADTTRGRGNSALKASVDWEYRMDKHSSGLRTLRCTKSKDHAQPEPINFIPKEVILDGWFDEDGQVMTSLVLVKTDTTTAQDKKRLTGFNKNGFDALISAMGNGASAHVDAWREAAYSAGITASSEPEAKKKAFQRLTRHLLINDYVETKDDYWWPKVDISPGHAGQDRDMSLPVPTPYRDGTGQGYIYPVPCPGVPSRSEVSESGVRV